MEEEGRWEWTGGRGAGDVLDDEEEDEDDDDGDGDLQFALLIVGKEEPGPGVRWSVTP